MALLKFLVNLTGLFAGAGAFCAMLGWLIGLPSEAPTWAEPLHDLGFQVMMLVGFPYLAFVSLNEYINRRTSR